MAHSKHDILYGKVPNLGCHEVTEFPLVKEVEHPSIRVVEHGSAAEMNS